MEKSEKVLLLSTIILVGFVSAVIFHYILGFYLDWGSPFNSFLLDSKNIWVDFSNNYTLATSLNPYRQINAFVNYLPIAYILIFPFTLIKNLIVSYCVFFSIFLSFLIFMNIKVFSCKNLDKMQNFKNIFILTAAFYPVLFVLDKGNFDMFLFILFALFIYAFKAEKYYPAAILLAIANVCKPLFILFLFLFIFKKRYKEFFLSIIIAIMLVVSGFLILKGGILNDIAVLLKSSAIFKYFYVYSNANNYGLSHTTSLFPMLKFIFCKATTTPIISVALLVKIYNILCLIINIIILFFTWKEKQFWKQITLLTCGFLLLPYFSFSYELIFLLIPVGLFINEKLTLKSDLTYTIIFALLFMPKNFILDLNSINSTIALFFSIEIFLNPILLITIVSLIIFDQVKTFKNTDKKV